MGNLHFPNLSGSEAWLELDGWKIFELNGEVRSNDGYSMRETLAIDQPQVASPVILERHWMYHIQLTSSNGILTRHRLDWQFNWAAAADPNSYLGIWSIPTKRTFRIVNQNEMMGQKL